MKRSRFTEEQIIRILKEHESDVSVADLCRKHGVSGASIYKWKAKFGGMEVSEAKRLKTLEDFDPVKLGQYATIEVATLCAPVVGVQSVILA
jgi:putative transposase